MFIKKVFKIKLNSTFLINLKMIILGEKHKFY